MRAFADRRKELKQLLTIARHIGDGFAWFFYQYETDLLRQHAARPAPSSMSRGAGGQAEVQLSGGVQSIQGHFVLHHCCTNMLRLGDVSLWNRKTGRIVGLGEIKTGTPDGDSVLARLHLLFPSDADINLATEGEAQPNHAVLSGQHYDRLQRQLGAMTKALGSGNRMKARRYSRFLPCVTGAKVQLLRKSRITGIVS